MGVLSRYHKLLSDQVIRPDPEQLAAAQRLNALCHALKQQQGGVFSFLRAKQAAPRGLYIWGDVGRGKSMLMDLFFAASPVQKKTRLHFNDFMMRAHARIHAQRQSGNSADPIPPVAKQLAAETSLLCFDEFQVSDVADAMILGRLFEQLFALNVVIVATSNTPPSELYLGGLNRQLFLPFIRLIQQRLDVVNLDGERDYRLHRLSGMKVYLTPLGLQADQAMEEDWQRLRDAPIEPRSLTVMGRQLVVQQASGPVARFAFEELCARPLAAADYLAIARHFHTVLIDHIPVMGPEHRNEARRFMLLIDTLYDEGVKLICSAAAEPGQLYAMGDGAKAFQRTASRLSEMRSADYLDRALRNPAPDAAPIV